MKNAAGPLTTYTWDGEDRLTLVVQPDGTRTTMAYDATGLRRSKQPLPPRRLGLGPSRRQCNDAVT